MIGPSPASKFGPDESRTCLIVSSTGNDHAFFSEALGRLNWRCHSVDTCRKARAFLERNSVAVVVAEEQLAMGGWKEMIQAPGHRSCPPKLVVTSWLPGESPVPKAREPDAYYVLLRPFDEREALHVIVMARSAWLEERCPAPSDSHVSSAA